MQDDDRQARTDEQEEQETSIPTNVIADLSLLDAVKDLHFVRSKMKHYRAHEMQLKGFIEMKMGDSPNLVDSNAVLLLTYKYSKDGFTFDMDRFKKEKPTLHKSYLIPKKGSRTLLLKGEEKDE